MRRALDSPEVDAPPSDPEIALLVGSPLFDHEWYARETGVRRDRRAAAEHYLRAERSVTRPRPHPLFDPDFYRQQLDDDQLEAMGSTDPLVFYIRQRTYRRATHPLFDTRRYLRRYEESRHHPGGPVAHYTEVGARDGLRPNDWLQPDEAGRHPDLIEWLSRRYDDWSERRGTVPRVWRRRPPRGEQEFRRTWADRPVPAGEDGPLVSVVLNAGLDRERLVLTLRSLEQQTLTGSQVLVLDRGGIEELTRLLTDELPSYADRLTVLPGAHDAASSATAAALGQATGRYVAFLDGGDVWDRDRLRLLVTYATGEEHAAVADGLSREKKDGVVYAVHGHARGEVVSRAAADLHRLLVRRSLLEQVGGVDTTVRGGWAFDLVLRIAQAVDVVAVPVIGTHRPEGAQLQAHRLPPSRRPWVDHDWLESWQDVALNRHLIDWSELAAREQRADVVSVIVPTYHDYAMTVAAVESVVALDGEGGHSVEVVVWDNGCPPAIAAVLDSLPERFPQVKVAHSAVNHGFALGNNLALREATGGTVVFLNNDTTVTGGWLAPLVEALQDPTTLGAQSLLVYPTGAIQSAGVAFPSTGGLPYAFLQGFPAEDATGTEDLELSALTGAALAMRWQDVVEARGFDPVFTNGMEDVDLCLRLKQRRPGAFRVRPDSVVVHHESRSAGRYDHYLINRAVYLERWRGVSEPRDDVALWRTRGLTVVDHEVRARSKQRDLQIPLPVLVRTAKLEVSEGAPRLRWAIKNPAPYGAEGDGWGDTHFAAAVARALRTLGQEVVVDRRPEFDRETSRHDDVALVLRGLARFSPSPENVTIGWVISHPEMVGPAEARSFDRLVAASVPWAEQKSREWGIDIAPLLQATDPEVFHPDKGEPDTGHAVLFVGRARKIYRDIIRDSVEAGLPLSIYGEGWHSFVHKRYIQAPHLPNAELSGAYRSAGVVLNDHWADMRDQGFLSNRLFDAVGSGARVITDDVVGLREVFGDSVQVYRTPEDLTRLSSLADPDSVFGSDELRRAEAARIHRDHSFEARARQLLDLALEARKVRGFSA